MGRDSPAPRVIRTQMPLDLLPHPGLTKTRPGLRSLRLRAPKGPEKKWRSCREASVMHVLLRLCFSPIVPQCVKSGKTELSAENMDFSIPAGSVARGHWDIAPF
ncbi:unnamed protein product [Effrenium voratum]|uniref:Uncharacterized protein n=1 Tax=Effrenium voratum TaxID=2562239 RepID=A0AA36JB36_9DINO|nr:unnamed protein product [Effrenium voratum]CAJ1422189.1 unnamed protein product [Effrenium voratum]